MRRRIFILLAAAGLLFLTGCGAPAEQQETPVSRQIIAMDTVMQFSVYGQGAEDTVQAAVEEVQRLEELLSRTVPDSEVSRLNDRAGERTAVDREVYDLMQAAVNYAAETNGSFDVTVAPVVDAWGFTSEIQRVPAREELERLLPLVDSGSISIDGRDLTHMPEHKRARYIGRVFQDPMQGTAATMQIEENLALAARRGKRRTLRPGITKAERAEYIERLKILDLGLEERLTSKVGLLSGGQRQALTLLMATLIKPQLLLLDEHTAALDPKTAAKVLDATDLLVSKDHLTTLMITHNMKDAIAHGNRLIMMYEGRIVIDVSGEEKRKLTVPQLLELFNKVSGSDEADDKLLLS